MIYSNLILNKKKFDELLKFKNTNQLPNAFIFHGNEGIGKEGHAIEFFAALNCKLKKNTACGHCISCMKTKKLQHEDLNIIFPLPINKPINKNDSPLKALNNSDIDNMNKMLHDKGLNPYSKIKFQSANTILINSIREIKKNINLSVDNEKCKIYLILEAEKLCFPNTESANSILKILEEPPANVLFILITSDISLLIDTITSRCTPIYFPKLKNNEIEEYLKKIDSNNLYNLEISKISNGSITEAILLSNDYQQNMEILSSIIRTIIAKDIENINEVLKHFRDKNSSIRLLNLLNIFFRSILIDNMDFQNMNGLLENIKSQYKDTNWESCILLVNNTQNYILKNGNIELMITSLFFEIKKILNQEYHNINIVEDYLNYKT